MSTQAPKATPQGVQAGGKGQRSPTPKPQRPCLDLGTVQAGFALMLNRICACARVPLPVRRNRFFAPDLLLNAIDRISTSAPPLAPPKARDQRARLHRVDQRR